LPVSTGRSSVPGVPGSLSGSAQIPAGALPFFPVLLSVPPMLCRSVPVHLHGCGFGRRIFDIHAPVLHRFCSSVPKGLYQKNHFPAEFPVPSLLFLPFKIPLFIKIPALQANKRQKNKTGVSSPVCAGCTLLLSACPVSGFDASSNVSVCCFFSVSIPSSDVESVRFGSCVSVLFSSS